MRKRSGDTGLRAGEWDGVAAADSTEEEGAVGFRYASAMVGRNFSYRERVGDWIIGDSRVPHEIRLSEQRMGHFSKTRLL